MPKDRDVPADERSLFLSFGMGGEVFAVPVGAVHGVIDPLPQAFVPNAGPFAPALINVRGSVVPVIDLAHRLGLAREDDASTARLVVLDIEVGDQPTKLAFAADRVEEVLEVESADIQPMPERGMRWPPELIAGVAMRGEDLLILLDMSQSFGLPQIEGAAA